VIPVKVLLIDDDEEELFIVRDALSEFEGKYRVEWASNYEEGLEKLLSNSYDAALLDHFLGARSGLELLKEASSRGCRSVLIFISGKKDPRVDLDAIRLGASDYLVKSDFSPPSLERSIRYALERKRTQELVAEQQRQHAIVMRMASLGEMAGGIAHEIVNPLSIALGRSEQLIKGLEAGQDKEKLLGYARIIEKTTLRSLDIVRSLRNFTAGQKARTERVDLSKVFSDIDTLARKKFDFATMRLELPYADLSRFEAYGHDPDIVQILFVLLNNALDAHKGEKDAWVKIDVATTPDGTSVDIQVTDSGKGISPEIRQSIFSPFFTTKGSSGTGLGLSIARKLAESHGGRLLLDEGHPNTRFVVRLPSKPETVEQATLPVLIVDDDPWIREILREAFAERNYDTILVRNGLEALEVARERELKAIVTDLRMPDCDGLELILRLQTLARKPPPIYLTSAHLSDGDTVQRAGMEVFFYEKPFSVGKLVDDVINHRAKEVKLG
jgi:signal transduction histidine kinase